MVKISLHPYKGFLLKQESVRLIDLIFTGPNLTPTVFISTLITIFAVRRKI